MSNLVKLWSFRELTPDTWVDLESLFKEPGGPKSCWCMAWRATPAESRKTDGASRKLALAKRLHAWTPIGLLAYLDGEPVGWCSVAPRSTHRRLVSDKSPDEGVWSITCFYVVRRMRGTGVAKRLLAAAIDNARKHGAKVIESYPVDRDSPSYRFMGFVPMFEKAGFHHCHLEGKHRHVMRLGEVTSIAEVSRTAEPGVGRRDKTPR